MPDSSDLTHLKIVIISSYLEMRALLRSQLYISTHADITEAVNGPEGLSQIREVLPQAVIVSLNITPFDGIAFTRRLRNSADSPHPYVPILLLLPKADLNRFAEARDAGVNAILLSPVSMKSLRQHLNEVIFHPRPFIRTKTYFGPDRRMIPRPPAPDRLSNAAPF